MAEFTLPITFKSFRHWGGTKITELSNGNLLVIMRILRHKSFKSSLKYINSIQHKEQAGQNTTEITVACTATHFFRRPKRFGGLNQIWGDKVE